MEKDITDKIRKKFLEFRNYRHKRLGEPWELTLSEWVEFFTQSDERALTIMRSRGVGRLYRRNERLPWQLDNLAIADKAVRKEGRCYLDIQREADATLSEAFDRFAIEEPSDSTRTLTPKQWLAELRELGVGN
ncbi:hypothetical protein [Sinorhizobium sp. BG8]|uniref:hypothetical protein n=1 Tax=Sinorhizobium sp. BG8 TaxID=2613773 RepID=UPI00193CB106|nr:hypothetical protein [Sinorhizobium sp. BG8]QRM54713.1 hypothetical protein F3Y30_09295 [Sinorhizobium sp. BG8]